jgi:hypothetical protein
VTYKDRLAQFRTEHPKLYSVYLGDLRPCPPSPDIKAAVNETLTCDACGATTLKEAFGVWCTRCARWHHVGGNCLLKLPLIATEIAYWLPGSCSTRERQQVNNLLRIEKEAIVGLYQKESGDAGSD